MNAEYIYQETAYRFTVGTEQRQDSTVGPPYRCALTLRECASGPVAVLDLELCYVDEERDIAIYRIAGRQVLVF